jgi:hypothetical protein
MPKKKKTSKVEVEKNSFELLESQSSKKKKEKLWYVCYSHIIKPGIWKMLKMKGMTEDDAWVATLKKLKKEGTSESDVKIEYIRNEG